MMPLFPLTLSLQLHGLAWISSSWPPEQAKCQQKLFVLGGNGFVLRTKFLLAKVNDDMMSLQSDCTILTN